MSKPNNAGQESRLEPLVGRLRSIAAGWKLRAMELEKCKVMLSAQYLRECADEVEALIEGRNPKRTSWFRHENQQTPNSQVQATDARSEAGRVEPFVGRQGGGQ